MVDVTVTINAKDYETVQQRLLTVPKELELVQRRAINATVKQAGNEIQRDIPLNMPAKRKKAALFSSYAKGNKLIGVIGARDFDTPLTWFSGWREKRRSFTARAATKKSSGITARSRLGDAGGQGLFVKWYKGGSTISIPNGFILRKGSNLQGRAFMRAPKGFGTRKGEYYHNELNNPGKLVPRLAVWPIYGPSVYDEFEERLKKFGKRTSQLYLKKLGQEINYILSRR